MKNKVEIPITVEYFGEDPLWRYISPRDNLKAKELAPNVVLEYKGTYFRKASGVPQIDYLNLLITIGTGVATQIIFDISKRLVGIILKKRKENSKIINITIGEVKITNVYQLSEKELEEKIRKVLEENIQSSQ